MKRVGLWAAMGIGLFITVGLFTVEPGYAEEKEHEPTCTLKTLKGRYLFGGISTLLPPAFGVTQQSLAFSAWPLTFPEHRALGVAVVRVQISSRQGESE